MKPPLGGLHPLGWLGASLHLLEVKGSPGRSRQSGAAVRAQGVFTAHRESWRVRCMRIHRGWGTLSPVTGSRLHGLLNKQLQRSTFLDFPDGVCEPCSVRSRVCAGTLVHQEAPPGGRGGVHLASRTRPALWTSLGPCGFTNWHMYLQSK